MNITVTVDAVDLSTRLGDTYDSEGHEPRTLGDAVAAQIVRELMKTDDWRGVKGEVERIRKEVIRQKVHAEIEAALTQPVQKTNTFGEPTSEGTTTIRAEIMKMAGDALKHGADRYNSHEGGIRRMLREEVERVLAADFKKVLDGEKQQLLTAARAKAAELITETARQFAGVPR